MRSGRFLAVPSRFLLLRPGCLVNLTKMFRCLPVFFDASVVFSDQRTVYSKALPRILHSHLVAAQPVACVCMPAVFQDGTDFWRCFSGFVLGWSVFCLVMLNRFSHMGSLLYRFSNAGSMHDKNSSYEPGNLGRSFRMPHTRHRPCRLLTKKSKRNFAKNLEIDFKYLYFVPSLTPKMRKMENLIQCIQAILAALTIGLCLHVILSQTFKNCKK